MRGFARNVEIGRNRIERGLPVFQSAELLDQLFAILRHLVQQRLGKKARRFRNLKLDGATTAFFHQLQERLVLLGREVRVELLTQGRNHDLAVET